MNCKLEKFWNSLNLHILLILLPWTVNLKSFEIYIIYGYRCQYFLWTVNLKSFEIDRKNGGYHYHHGWTVNLKSFEI